MLAISQDYRFAPSPRGQMCLNELVFGAPLKPAMAALFRYKIPAISYRTLILEAKRFNAEEAVAAGIADGIADKGLDSVLEFVKERDLTAKPKSGVYGTLKAEMYKELIAFLKSPTMEVEEARADAEQQAEAERMEFGRVWYDQWSKETKAKL